MSLTQPTASRFSFFLTLAIAALVPIPCLSQAPNDNCAAAFVAIDGFTAGTNIPASLGPDPLPTCGSMSNDVWYSYTASCTGTATVSLCHVTTNFDTLLAAWSGSCGCLSEIACNDDAACATPGGKSTVTFSSMAGTTYYISVGGFDGGAGNFGMIISCVNGPSLTPPNDTCGSATSITEGVMTAGTSANATTGGGGCPGDPTGSCSVMSNDVWYVFTASCTGTYQATTCVGATSFDTVVAVWDGSGGCGSLVEIGCNDTGGCTLVNQGNSAIATWSATAGTTYFVSVGGFIGLTGSFDLHVAPTGTNPVLSFFDVGPGTIGFSVVGGPPLGIAFTGITLTQGAFPTGAFFGIDITATEVIDQFNAGFPFLANLGPCGELTVGPVGGAPSGITLYAVTLTAQNAGLVLYSWSPPVTVTIP